MRKLIFTVAVVNTVLNFMVISLFMADEVITFYNISGEALFWGSKWFFGIYAIIPLIISGAFFVSEIISNKNNKLDDDEEEKSAIDDFLSGISTKSDNADMLLTWFSAIISWVMSGFALNNIENIGVIMPSIIVVILSSFVIFTSSLYSGGDNAKLCGISVKWLENNKEVAKRSKRLAMMLGVTSGMIGVCLAAWSIVVNNNMPNCIAVVELVVMSLVVPMLYSRLSLK